MPKFKKNTSPAMYKKRSGFKMKGHSLPGPFQRKSPVRKEPTAEQIEASIADAEKKFGPGGIKVKQYSDYEHDYGRGLYGGRRSFASPTWKELSDSEKKKYIIEGQELTAKKRKREKGL